jgi:hypothetical protein
LRSNVRVIRMRDSFEWALQFDGEVARRSYT